MQRVAHRHSDEIHQLRAEIDRLRADRDAKLEVADHNRTVQWLCEARAEIERLRGTLRYIADNGAVLGGAACQSYAMAELEAVASPPQQGKS